MRGNIRLFLIFIILLSASKRIFCQECVRDEVGLELGQEVESLTDEKKEEERGEIMTLSLSKEPKEEIKNDNNNENIVLEGERLEGMEHEKSELEIQDSLLDKMKMNDLNNDIDNNDMDENNNDKHNENLEIEGTFQENTTDKQEENQMKEREKDLKNTSLTHLESGEEIQFLENEKQTHNQKIIEEDNIDQRLEEKRRETNLEFPAINEYRDHILSELHQGNGEKEKENTPSKDDTRGETKTSEDASVQFQDRFNFASAECGAKVLKTNSEAKESTSILYENKDRYLLNPCSAEKWIIIELCEEIGVDAVAVGSFEFYSSMFQDFRILVSSKYPTQHWEPIQNFTAENRRDTQFFKLDKPAWTRYIKFEFVTHYGDQHYCPVSIVRVFGVTLAAELRELLQKDHQEVSELSERIKRNKNKLKSEEGIINDLPEFPQFDLNVEYQPIENLQMNERNSTNHNESNSTSVLPSNISEDISSQSSSNLPNSENIGAINSESLNAFLLEHSMPAGPKTHESIFRTLANRIKTLEISQSISGEYLEDLTASYGTIFKELTSNINEMRSELSDLSSIVQKAARQAALMSEKQDKRIHLEVHDQINVLATEQLLKISILQAQIQKQEESFGHLYNFMIVAGTIFISIILYEEARINQFMNRFPNNAPLSTSPLEERKKSVVLVPMENPDNIFDSIKDQNHKRAPNSKKKKNNSALKRAKSLGQLLEVKEAPV